MSKMNELSIDHDSYEQYIEEGNTELRREGAKELLIELVRLGVLTDSGEGLYSYADVSAEVSTTRKFADLRGFI